MLQCISHSFRAPGIGNLELQGWEILVALGDLGRQCVDIISLNDLYSSEGPRILTLALKQVLQESATIRNNIVYDYIENFGTKINPPDLSSRASSMKVLHSYLKP